MLGWLLAILAVLVVMFWALGGGSSDVHDLDDAGRYAYVGILVLFAAAYAVLVSGEYRGRWRAAAKHAAIWIGLGLLLIGGYAYRDDLSGVAARVASEVLPPGEPVSAATLSPGEKSVRLRKRPDGHFVARAEVQGTSVGFLVDTGASTVVLKPADAERAGVDVGSLSYTVAVSTANGTTYAASVRLARIQIGPIEVTDVEALVAQPGNLKENLLGMSFLKRLRSYEVSGDFLTLRG